MGTDAGELAGGDTAVVQTIKLTDTDRNDTSTVNLTAVTVAGSSDNTASAADLSSVRILDADGNELASAAPTDNLFGTGQTFDISDVTIPDDGSTTLQVSVTVAANVSESAVLGLETNADWKENGSSGQTAFVSDGKPESLGTAATNLNGNETVDSGNQTADSDNQTADSGNETVGSNETTDSGNQTVDSGNETIDSGNQTVDSGNETIDSGDETAENDTVTTEPTGEMTTTPDEQNATTNETEQNTTSSDSATATLNNSSAAPDLQIVSPENQTIVESDDLLDVTYGYVEDVPDDVVSTRVTLTDEQGTSYDYTVDKADYVAGATVTVPLDLDKPADNLTDGAYYVEVAVTNASGDTETTQTATPVVVVNDEAPTVGNVSITSNTTDLARDAALNLTYDYGPAPNASSVTVWVVDSEDTANFTSGDLANASYTTYEQSVDHGVVADRNLTVGLGYRLADNANYSVFVTATDATGLQSNASATGTLDVNAEKPSIESVEATIGSDTVTVHFTETVVAGDGDDNISRADFAFQNGNDGGAGSITSVVVHSGDTVTLGLDANVTLGDLDSDHVSVRSGQLVDTHDDDPRAVGTGSVALDDTIPPGFGSITVPDINASNTDNYRVAIDTYSDATDVTVTLTGSGGTTVTKSKDAVTGEANFTLNATSLDEGYANVEFNLTDRAGNSQIVGRDTEKDTVAPTLESVTTNAGTKEIELQFSEFVADPSTSDFELSNLSHKVNTTRAVGGDVLLTLNESLPASAINSSDVVISASGVTDIAGNPATNDHTLDDVDAPTLSGVAAEPGDEQIVVTFSEDVTPGADETFTVDDFGYTENNSSGVTALESVTQTGPQTVVLETNGPLTPDDLEQDNVTVAANSVYDVVGHSVSEANYTIGVESELKVSVNSGTMTVTVVSLKNITNATDLGITISEMNRELDSLEGFELDDRFVTTLNASDFEQTESDVFEATVTVPSDGDYAEDGEYRVTGSVDGQMRSKLVSVDTTAPHPTDAVLLDVTDAAQLDDTRNTTEIRVLFNEPINASNIMPSDVSIEGFDGEIIAVQNAGPFGSVTIITEGKVQTGTRPTVTIDGDSYVDAAGTNGNANSQTVIHTDVLDLETGRNFVSVPASSGDLSLDEVNLSAVDAIYAYDAESGSWDAFDPDASENDITALEGGNGYIFVMDHATTLTLNVYNRPGSEQNASDIAPAPTQQELTEGWNLVGHYQEYDQNVSTALSSLDSDSVYNLLAHDESADSLAYRSYNAGDFETMDRGEAYWVFVRNDEVYTEATRNTADS
ncbi:putative cell surface glycoprotein [Haloferax mediterranei ATCC 33500]|nr:putative cell surface glycoprotein [Haloferax mediterranei ATCC 33500]